MKCDDPLSSAQTRPTLVELDIVGNRAAAKWSRREQVGRVLWSVAWPFFRFSPRPFWRFRCLLLRLFGAQVGVCVHLYPTVRITIPWNLAIGDHSAIGDGAILYALGPITMGANVTVSQGAHLCAGTHDFRSPSMTLVKSAINIGDGAWICADAFIGPGVEIGAGAVVGARAVAMRSVLPALVVAGNPARKIGERQSHLGWKADAAGLRDDKLAGTTHSKPGDK
ncbi:putative colanic acid biosynthesis acetyltransferase [Mesorhizobium sp. M1405]|uniref:putative colanic acid biosynthesis acetyltransferase n=1 Tax=Mesorhizobium sp. M1405 TaxID=2957098 RepID=UPI00333A54E7